MSIAKVLEVIAEGKTIEGAVSDAVTEASKTIKDIQGVYVESIKANVENGQVTGYRVNVKMTFIVQRS